MAKKTIDRAKDFENGKVTFTVLDDNGDATDMVVEASAGDFPDEIREKLIVHAINAKIGDAAAGEKGQEAYDAMRQVYDQLVNGTWTARTAGEGGGRVTMLAQAIARLKNLDPQDAANKLDDYGDDEKKELQKHPAVKAEMDKIRAERAAERAKKNEKDADASDLDF